MMPVDFLETDSQPIPSLHCASDRREVLLPAPLVLLGRCQAPAGAYFIKGNVLATVDNVLPYLAQRVDPTAPGTPSLRHRILLAEVIEILCLLNDTCHLR